MLFRSYQEEKKDLLEALELYYRTFFLEEDVDWEERDVYKRQAGAS